MAGRGQLQRREWKAGLLQQLTAAQGQPPLGVDALRGRADVSYRKLRVVCAPRTVPVTEQGGESAFEGGGTLYVAPCHAGGITLPVVAGWSMRPRAVTSLTLPAVVTGTVAKQNGRYLLVSDTATPPLAKPLQPSLDDIPNNHLQYAFTWFAMAGVLAVIYVVYVRRWRGEVAARRLAR